MQARRFAYLPWAVGCLVGAVGCGLLIPACRKSGTEAAEESSGQAKDGLRTRLVADKPAWTVGERVVIRLELRNEGKAAQTYDDPQGVTSEGGLTIRRDGKPVRYIAGPFQTLGGSRLIAPGQTQTIDTIFVSDYWDCRTPGRYTVQFPETRALGPPFPGADAKSHRAALPPSGVLELEVKLPPGGKAPPLDVQARGQVYLGRNVWMVPDWQGLVFNYDPELPPASADWLTGAFATILPQKSLPVYDNRLVLLAVRMPRCGEDSRFEVHSATVEDHTIRISVLQQAGRGARMAPFRTWRPLPYLVFPLDRLLGPGDYTCDVRLAAERRESPGKPEVDGYRFGFAVLPARD